MGKLLAVFLLIRFAIPAVSIASDVIYRTFMAEDYRASQQAIALSTAQLRQESPAQPGQALARKKDECWMLPEWLCRKLDGGSDVERQAQTRAGPGLLDRVQGAVATDVPGTIGKLGEVAESTTEHVVKLMVVFLLQTLIVPLGLRWALLRGVGLLLQARPRSGHCSHGMLRQTDIILALKMIHNLN